MPNIDCWNSTKEVTNSHLSVPLCLYLELSPATTVEAGRCLGEDNPLLLYPQPPGPMLSLWAGSQAESTPTPFPNEVSQLCGKCSLLRAQSLFCGTDPPVASTAAQTGWLVSNPPCPQSATEFTAEK